MAAISGKAGLVEWGDGLPLLSITAWDMSIDNNLLEITSWTTGTEMWRSCTPGLNGASGSFNGFVDSASTLQTDLRGDITTPTAVALRLYTDRDGGEHFAGSAYLTSFGNSVDIDGTADLTASFTFSGAVTFTTTT